MIVLYFGDIFGKPGRQAVRKALPDLIATYSPDFIIGNAENLAGGRGVNKRTYEEMVSMGFHGFTSGNHIFDNKEVYQIMETDAKLIRPANYLNHPDYPCPGKGWMRLTNKGKDLIVINLIGRLFMDAMDCPFAAVDKILKEVPAHTPVLVDMHADATSEKYAMGFHLDGRVAAVVGSHSHVQTADERLLPKGTAYITDVGMSGAFDSVIGLRHTEIVKRFMTKRHIQTGPAKDNPGVGCVIINLNAQNKATSIERLRFSVAAEGLYDDKDLE